MNQPVKKRPVKPGSIPAARKKEKPSVSVTDKFFQQNGHWIAIALLALLIIIVFRDFLSGNLYYLFKDIGSDSLNFSYPQFVQVKEYLRTEGYPTWSFSQGMGQNLTFAMTDPFTWIVFLSGQGYTAYSIFLMELVKMVFSAFFFYRFLRLLNLSKLTLVIGTILYTFSSFIIIGSGWNTFSTEACLLAMLLYSFELVYQKSNWYLFPLAIALIGMFQPFDLYLYGLFLILYLFLRHFTGETPSWKKLLNVGLILAGCSLLGLLVSSFFLVSKIQVIMDSPRVGGNASYFQRLYGRHVFSFEDTPHNATAILRLFSNDILGNGSNFKGWYNYLESPMFYIGLLPLLVFPQIFLFAPRKKKIFYILFLAVVLIPVIFPFFRYTVWLFTGDYYRGFSLYVSIALLLMSLYGLNEMDKGRKINLVLLGGTFVFLLILLFYPFVNIDQVMDKGVQSSVLNFLIFYVVILALSWFDAFRPWAKIILVLAVFVEAAYFNFHTVNDRAILSAQEMKEKKGYNDYSVDAVSYIKEKDKSFYRVNKNYTSDPAVHTSFNDAQVQGFFGTMSYFSFNQKYYIRFLEEAGIIKKGEEYETRWAQGVGFRSLLFYTSSIKYQLDRDKIVPSQLLEFDSIGQTGNIKILKIKHFMPLGFTYNKYVPFSVYTKLSGLRKDITLQKAFVAEDPVDPEYMKSLVPYNFSDTLASYTYNDLFSDLDRLKEDTLAVTSFSQKRIKGIINAGKPEMLFFSIPYDKGWHARVDGKEQKPVLCNVGFTGIFIKPGNHEIDLYYKPLFFHESALLSVAGIVIYLGLILFAWYKRKNRGKSL